ncbi:1476_t:CDS:10, partial [Ambispora leptoticha]
NREEKSKEINKQTSSEFTKRIRQDLVTDLPPMKQEQLNRPYGYSSGHETSPQVTRNREEKSKEINKQTSFEFTKGIRQDLVTDLPPMKQEQLNRPYDYSSGHETSPQVTRNREEKSKEINKQTSSEFTRRIRQDLVTDLPPMKQDSYSYDTLPQVTRNREEKSKGLNNQVSSESTKNNSKKNVNEHQRVATNSDVNNNRFNDHQDLVADPLRPIKGEQFGRPHDGPDTSPQVTRNREEESKENNQIPPESTKNNSKRSVNEPPRVATNSNVNNNRFNDHQDLVADSVSKMEQEQSHDITVSFHVHMPSSLKGDSQITVFGNIPELGEWERPCVAFRYYGVDYWISEPIKISMSSIEKVENICYKYAILKTRTSFWGKKEHTRVFEGKGPHDNRMLDLGKTNFYDIWRASYEYPMRGPKECLFVKDIYSSLSERNLKEKIMEYQSLRKAYPGLIVSSTSLNFIENNAKEINTFGQKIFLCILLGYYIEHYHNANKSFQAFFQLPESFPSSPLLEGLYRITSDSLPSNTTHLLLPTISTLVKQNSSPVFNGFEWMNLFAVAPVIDPNYTFLDDIQKWEYDENNSILLKESLENKAKPAIDNIKSTKQYKIIIKKLISLTTTIDMLVFLWQNMVRSEITKDSFLYSEVHDHTREHFYKLIASKNAEVLLECLNKLSNDFHSLVAQKIRKKVLEILQSQKYHWTKRSVDSISCLLCEDRLSWPTNEVFQALDLISKSNNFQLLESFPKSLHDVIESVFEYREQNFWKKLSIICIRWYQRILLVRNDNAAVHQTNGNVVNDVFFYLSQIYPIVAAVESITDSLQDIAIKQIENYNHDLVFRATSLIGNMHQNVQNCFEKMIKKRLDDVIQKSDAQKLLGHIMDICGCDNQNQGLKVPNKFSDEILLYMMNCLQKQISDSLSTGKIVSDNFHAFLLESAGFWVVVLQAHGTVKRLNSNMLVQKVKTTIVHLAELIKKSTIKITLLRNVLKHSNRDLIRYFGAVKDNKIKITENELQSVREEYTAFENRFMHLNDFYTHFCSDPRLTDAHEYIKDMDYKMQSFEDTTLSDILSVYWDMHESILNIAEKSHLYINSQTFSNVFEDSLKKETQELSVLVIAESIMPKTLIKHETLVKKCNNLKTIKVSEALLLWENTKNIDEELEFLSDIKYLRISKELKDSIRDLVSVSKWKERLQQLINAAEICNVEDKRKKFAKLLENIDNQENSFGDLSRAIQEVNKSYGAISDDCWSLIKELSTANKFIEFLRRNAEYDLKNLINAVDDHSDEQLIREDTVSSLIQIKHFLLPIVGDADKNKISGIDAFIKELSSISNKNPALSKKLTLCNLHRLALENMCANILRKGEVTKKRIKNAATIGIYEFQRPAKEDNCTVQLTYYWQDQPAKYTLNDLLDLRGRALLIAKSANSVKQMPTDEEDEDDFDESYINKFVHDLDMVQEILKVASKLIQLGHFKYRELQEKVEVKNEEEINGLLEKLFGDLTEWETMINQAQEHYYYLTFYPARHILTFYDYFFENSNNLEIKNSCEILLKYVNKQAKLPPANANHAITCETASYDKIFGEIGKILHNIFESTPKRIRNISASINCIHSDVVKSGQLFVASCDKGRMENTIMSLFANYKTYPEPWQIFICRSNTTAEELSLFIKRCFLAASNGYENRLFCIANLEVLDVELQYNLVNDIRALSETKKQYDLALICCPEPGIHHHITDQFREHVHVSNGLDSDSMKNIYGEICQDVIRVSSDLSGQGKTEWIRQTSMAKGLIPRSFLVSDDIQYGKFVRQLKENNLRREFESIHFNILSVKNPGELNRFLFELLTLGMVSNGVDIVELPDTSIYIEVASTVDQYLLNSLPFTEYLTKKELEWDDEHFIASREPTSPIQVVARYLDAYNRKILNETDISILTGDPIPANRCQELLNKYFFEETAKSIYSYRYIEIFTNVLADQLIRMSASTYFQVENIELMVDERNRNIRALLMEQFIETGKEFATRSIASKLAQIENDKASQSENIAEFDTARLGAILPWEESNHLLVVFLSQSPDSIAAFYNDREKVPASVKKLLQSQQANRENPELEDYHEMPPEILLNKLESLARKSMKELVLPHYALSADNLLKMALILLRARARIPVVICGEAGCGKTSLIHFLSMMVEVEFESLNLHAGIQEEKILESINKATNKAKKGEVWMFFDEINTCNHIGMLADLIAHRTLNGKLIHHNIRLFAAANPYRLRIKAQSSAGLKAKQSRYEERNRLVYQVNPLPDQILDYVWDYGILKRKDEYLYIQIMVKSLGETAFKIGLPELLSESQQFIRDTEEPYSVSLRDVKRTIKLVRFFHASFNQRDKNNNKHKISIWVRSCCLALGLCYQARLYEKDLRLQYRRKMTAIFRTKTILMKEEEFDTIIKEEQLDYFNRMIVGPSIAANSALLENILVMIVSILTRIPVFIIGAPGSSKSLAIRIISQNLRGIDSHDPYFRRLPGVYVVPHQGSTSSTSEGIIKVFDKARNYQKTSSTEFKVNAVVLLDEVGLAETSPFNPLKVLHSLLEPSFRDEKESDSDLENSDNPNNEKKFSDCPEVSVIGISNWRLDNSKSSRALLVQRPKFDRADLLETSRRILGKRFQKKYEFLADAYLEYEKNQIHPNFHAKSLHEGLIRNFGGTEKTQELCKEYFGQVLNNLNGKVYDLRQIPVDELINKNLEDKNARHLMVIGKSDSLIDILTYHLRQKQLDPVVICGSQFPDDQEDYAYAVLKRIMICVEAGRPLILSDLDIIYGSLYDLWNQNYYTAGTKEDPKHFTRVALGAYSNPMCFVHENFRCILIMDERKIKLAEPPLLNRFEKQRMSINDTLNDKQKHFVENLSFWVRQISNLAGTDFSVNDMFIGFNAEETVQSLVIDNCQKYTNLDDGEFIMTKCKESLISIATADGIVRSEKSALATTNPNEVAYWKNFYLVHQRHDDLYTYFEELLHVDNNSIATAEPKSYQTIINTFSNIHTDVRSILKGITCQVDKLSTFKTEAQLQNRVKHFWLESDSRLLILQCDVSVLKTRCIKLAKFIIEQSRAEYLARSQQPSKHACIILHTQRKNDANSCSFNFMCGWEQITIELLNPQESTLSNLLNGNLGITIESSYPFKNVIQQELLWCLSCIKYPATPKSVTHLRYLLQEIPNHPNFINIIKERVQQYLPEYDTNNWQLQVASDKRSLCLYTSLLAALQSFVRETIRKPIAKILCSLERLSATQTFLEIDNASEENDLLLFWSEIFMDKRIVNIDELQEPKPDLFRMPNPQHKLCFPFSFYFFNRINSFEKFYREDVSQLSEDENNLDDEARLLNPIMENLQTSFTKRILAAIPALRSPYVNNSMGLYYNDFITILSSEIIGENTEKLMSYIIRSELTEKDIRNPIKLHIYWWNNADSMMSKLCLAKLCPNVVETMLSSDYFGENSGDQDDEQENGENQENNALHTTVEDADDDDDDDLNNRQNDESEHYSMVELLATRAHKKSSHKHEEDKGKGKETEIQNYLLVQTINMVFEKLYDLADEEEQSGNEDDQIQHRENIRDWQRLVNIILLHCSKLSISSNTESFNLLRICNDLVSAKSIPLREIRKLIYSPQRDISDELLSIETINTIFELLDKLDIKESQSNPRQSFIMRCLNIIELDSPIREYLYEKIFSQKPFPLIGSIVLRIFEAETGDDELKNVFLDLIENPQKILRMSSRLQVINECLKKNGINSQMAALCTDVIQKGCFASLIIGELAPSFRQAIEVLCEPKNAEPLQLLSSIAYFKEFVSMFWRSIDSLDNSLNQKIQFTFMETDQTYNLIEAITQSLSLPNPLIHSLAIYFLKELRSLGFSVEQIKQLSLVQREYLPWISELPWDDTKRSRLPFNPYWILDAYTVAENAYKYSYSVFNNSRFDTLLKSLLQSHRVDERVAFIGLILARLHSPRIIAEELNNNEKKIYNYLRNQIQQMNLQIVYKDTVMKLFENKHPLIQLNPQTNDFQLLMVSVIIHIVAVIASLPPDHSPLSVYLHRLQACQETFILTCPTDLESVFLNVLFTSTHKLDGNNRRLTRYKCKCGYIYYIGNCGLPSSNDDKSVCPECKSTLGGKHHHFSSIDHKVPVGHEKLDATPLNKNDRQEDQTGYIVETCSTDQYLSVRAMTPASYRILHLFVHAIFGISAPSSTVQNFFGNVPDPVRYCLDHINNDWELDPVNLNTADERDQWERFFTNNLVVPLVKNVNGTAADLLTKLEAAATAADQGSGILEKEICETIEISEQYSIEYLPRLWRKIGNTTFDNLHAYFTSNQQNSLKYPFLDLFFKYEQKLNLIKNIRPIVKFVQLLSKQLGHLITRKQAQDTTFKAFIDKQTKESDENESHNLKSAFKNFKDAWNSVIPYVTRFQCHELEQKPTINEESSIILGLVEPKGESLYLCAILDYLVSLQNEFLQEVVTIPPGNCSSLRFLETEGIREDDLDAPSTSAATTRDPHILYYLKSMRLENIRPSNIIQYEWDDEILEFSQRNLEVLHGEEIAYDLYKMEMELARSLVFGKVYIEAISNNMYLENFLYHMELFHASMTLINDVKELIPQEPLPDRIKRNYNGQEGSISLENPMDLRSFLEILLCFVKRTAISDGEMPIVEFIKQWMNRSNSISENKIFQMELQLKHIVALYELIEDNVADLMMESIDNKYKSKLPDDMREEIKEVVEFESITQQKSKKFPAVIFASALKRFIVRYLLLEDKIRSNDPLYLYVCDVSLNCWPSDITEELLDLFPVELLVEHTYEAYQLIRSILWKNELKKRQAREENMRAKHHRASAVASSSRPSPNPKKKKGKTKFDKL